MKNEEVKNVLGERPFVPLTLTKATGETIEIPFEHVAVMQPLHLLVFKGVESGKSHFAREGFEAIGYAQIDRIEPSRSGQTRRVG